MDVFSRIAEERIKEAIESGRFNDIPGKGKPLELDDLSHVPEDLRMGYRMLKNAGFIPPELQLSREMVTLHDMLAACKTDAEREPLRKELNAVRLRLRMMLESRGMYDTGSFAEYEAKIRFKLEGDA